jgi:hypothetical protein
VHRGKKNETLFILAVLATVILVGRSNVASTTPTPVSSPTVTPVPIPTTTPSPYQIPDPDAKAKREHKRVVIAETDAGKSDGVDTGSGDQVVLIVKKDRNGREKDVKIVAKTDEVDERLDQIARQKFDDGKLDDSADIDKLRNDNRKQYEKLADKVSKDDDDDIADAGKDAIGKVDDAKQKESADPIAAIRKKATADNEAGILVCAAGVVGRPVSGEGDLSAGELDRVQEQCLDEDDQEGFPQDRGDDGDRDLPPDVVIECIIGVLGEVPAGSISEADKDLLYEVCRTDDDGSEDGQKGDRNDQSGKSIALKIAFCESNLSDPHCEGFDPLFNPDDLNIDSSSAWAGGGKGDFTEGEPISPPTVTLEELCKIKPEDAKCGRPGGSDSNDDKSAFCEANPGDAKCTVNSGDTKIDSGEGSTGTNDDSDGGDQSGSTDNKGGGGK